MKKILLLLIFGCFIFCSYAYDDIVGKEVILKPYSDSGVIYLGVDKKFFNCAISSLMTKKRDEYLALLLQNKIFEIPSLTKAKVLEVDFYSKAILVKILNGTYINKIGWVLMQDIME